MMDTNGHEALGNPQTKCLVTVITVIHHQLKPNAGIPGSRLGAALRAKVLLPLCSSRPSSAMRAMTTENRGQQQLLEKFYSRCWKRSMRGQVPLTAIHSCTHSLKTHSFIITAPKICYSSPLPSFKTPVDHPGYHAKCHGHIISMQISRWHRP